MPEETPSSKSKTSTPRRKQRGKSAASSAIVEVGDFILVDLIGYTQEDNQLFDTTREDIARQEDVYSDEEVYQPRLVIVGQAWVPLGVDEALVGMKVGETKQLILPPEKAFGLRDPKRVQILPKAKIKSEHKIVPGMRVRLGSQSGIIRRVGGGRVTVDFNHVLAGRAVRYEITLIQKYTKAVERVQALVHRRFLGVNPENIGVTVRASNVTITLTADLHLLLNKSLQIQKLGVTHDIDTYMKDKYSKVLFIEEWPVGLPKSET
ncbi:MAG: peptidylprolyl isomerase [Promethearchaeota archaeon]